MPAKKPLSNEQFQRLQKLWYARAGRGTGTALGFQFKDVECGRDLNRSAAQTFRRNGKPGVTNEQYVLWEFDRPGADEALMRGDWKIDGSRWDGGSISEHPKHEFFDRIETYANQPYRRNRDVLLAVIAKGIKGASKMLKRPVNEVRSIWSETLEKLGLPGNVAHPKRDKSDDPIPGPVRSLSAREIAGLNYTAPKQIKDKNGG